MLLYSRREEEMKKENKKSEGGESSGNVKANSQNKELSQKLKEWSESNVLFTFLRTNERGESKDLVSLVI